MSADQIYTWLKRHLPEGPMPPLIRPVNYMRIVSAVTILMGAVTLFTVLSPWILPIIQNRNLWAAISLIAILLFTSGQMFNHIRKVPYVTGDGKGGVSYFAGGFQNQFGLETQIVAAICKSRIPPDISSLAMVTALRIIRALTPSSIDAVLSFATIALALKVPRMEDVNGQQLAVMIWAAVLFATYSFLISVFKIKNGGYPFWLPPF